MTQTNMQPSLDRFAQTLRPYQLGAVTHALDWIERAQPGNRICYAAPTGTGKGTLQIALLKALRAGGLDAFLLSPSLEVLAGVVERCGGEPASNEEALVIQAAQCYSTTPTRLRNSVLRGDTGMPEVVLYDEVHHAIDDNVVSGTLFAVAPDALWVGFTATPYRGTPQGTKALHNEWGTPFPVLHLDQAVREGWASLPHCRVVPLVDDDTVTVRGGEFIATAANTAVKSRITALAELVRETWPPAMCFRKPTVVAVPSTETAGLLVEELDRLGVAASMIVQHTRRADRARILRQAERCETVIVQIKVISEGVDLPWLRRLIDARPTLSPVSWIQQLGRIMRPGERGEYICVCRNLERHAYLLGGVLPREAVRAAQAAFGAPSTRAGSRAIGLESLRRFKPIPLPLDGGVMGTMYSLDCPTDTGKTEVVALVDPQVEAPLVATRTVTYAGGDSPPGYGKWQLVPEAPELTGFGTAQNHAKLSAKQREWWTNGARRYGLDASAADKLTRRQFPALPLLRDLGLKIGRRS